MQILQSHRKEQKQVATSRSQPPPLLRNVAEIASLMTISNFAEVGLAVDFIKGGVAPASVRELYQLLNVSLGRASVDYQWFQCLMV
jgi:hypothetical protein